MKLTKKRRIIAAKLLKNITKIEQGVTITPFSDIKQHAITKHLLEKYGITQTMIDGYNEL